MEEEEEIIDSNSPKDRSVLVIEDDDDLREVTIKMLEIAGYQPFQASSRDEALKIMRETPEVYNIILDLSMPGMTMNDFLEKIKELQRKVGIIFSSGASNDEISRYTEELADLDYKILHKPYSLNHLQEALNSLLIYD